MSTRASWEELLLYLKDCGLEVCRRTVERWMNLAENPFPRPILTRHSPNSPPACRRPAQNSMQKPRRLISSTSAAGIRKKRAKKD